MPRTPLPDEPTGFVAIARRIAKEAKATEAKAKKLSVVEAKKAMKLLKSQGMIVTGIEKTPGGFVVTAAEPGAVPQAVLADTGNPWDEVLS